MSRVGELPIIVPSGVEVKISATEVMVKGPKGSLQQTIHPTVAVERQEDKLSVVLRKNLKEHKRFHGLTRTLINNMVIGVTQGFKKELSMIGVGYRANMKGKTINLLLGYSHPIEYTPLTGIDLQVDKQNNITVSGANKEHVGRVAATIRGFRPPEPYHGKGVRYKNEVIVTKVGKSSGKK